MRAVVLVVLAGCAPGVEPVYPEHNERECNKPWFVGEPLLDGVHWECGRGQVGRTDSWSSPDNSCKHVLEVTPRCEGVPCTATIETPRRAGYNGARQITITPQATGHIEVFLDIRHITGHVETLHSATCDVVPAPVIELTCTARDPRSGSYVPCPTPVPPGWEISFKMHGSVEAGEFPRWEGWYDDRELSYYRYWHEIECSSDHDAQVAEATCTTVAKPGHHSFAIRVGNLDKQTLHVDVK